MKTQTLSTKPITFSAKEIAVACAHIEETWNHLTKTNREDNGTLIGLPYPYVVPSADLKGNFVFEEMYYWDVYFTCLGLFRSGKNELAEGMLENLLHMYKRFHIIPNASRFYMCSRSQAPYLTSLIFDVYEKNEKSIEWLKEKIAIAEREYWGVWLEENHPNARNVFNGLSRYYDINVLHDLAEAESGWDMTTRFSGQCLNHIPIDLNSLLYKYEKDFARAYALFEDDEAVEIWSTRASVRANQVSTQLWDSTKGFFFDLNYKTGEKSEVWSLASFYTMWSGLATSAQAEKMVYNLKKFVEKGGVVTTLSRYDNDPREINTQWAAPNGWAPIHNIVIDGLLRYEYREMAEEIARRWMKTNLDYFKFFGVFREAYNVVEPLEDPAEGLYPPQTGFGWTNGVFLDLAHKFLTENERSLI